MPAALLHQHRLSLPWMLPTSFFPKQQSPPWQSAPHTLAGQVRTAQEQLLARVILTVAGTWFGLCLHTLWEPATRQLQPAECVNSLPLFAYLGAAVQHQVCQVAVRRQLLQPRVTAAVAPEQAQAVQAGAGCSKLPEPCI